MSPSTTSKVTTDHDEIRRWAEERGAKPAAVIRTESDDDPGIIRLDFPGYSGEGSLEPISWDEWFKKFDERKLALLYQEHTANGEKSNFNKIVTRKTADEVEEAVGGKRRSAVRTGSSSGRKATAASRPGNHGSTRKAASTSGRAKTAKKSTSSAGRAQTAKKSTSARGSSSSTGRARTRSRSSEQRSSRATAGGATRGSRARRSATTQRGNGGGTSRSRSTRQTASGSTHRSASRRKSK